MKTLIENEKDKKMKCLLDGFFGRGSNGLSETSEMV
jgi:hypothetical protein